VLEDAAITKAVHNQSVDHHALANHGVTLRGGLNTLGLVRWYRPELVNQPGRFKLKTLMTSLLGRPPICTFLELVSYERQVVLSNWKTRTERHCRCGTPGCRKRLGHEKYEVEVTEEVLKEKTERGRYALPDIVPGHERWDLLVRYAAEDAVAALELLDCCDPDANPAPWPYGGARPRFNQAVEEAVIDMEAAGVRVDVDFAAAAVNEAQHDEEAWLARLFKWYVWNAPVAGPHRQEDVDPIWSSPTKQVKLFDELGFPRSPIWGKGRVKRGDVKMDGAAMAWIGKNHPAAKQVTDLIVHLKRIRGGLKYLLQMRDSGGMVHPTCGPSGDDDERAGAVTGRLAVKGELPLQQLPTREDLDLYQVRKAIVA
jgi:hypothetical protein